MYLYHGDPLDSLPWSGLFFALVHNQPLTSYEKLGILRKSLSNECQRVIGEIQGDQRGYMRAHNLLRARYDNPEHLRATYLGALRSQPAVMENDASSFQYFADETRAHLAVLEDYCVSYTMATDLILELLGKLPMVHVLAWKAVRPRREEELTLQMFDSWIEERAEDYHKPGQLVVPIEFNVGSTSSRSKNNQNYRVQNNVTTVNGNQRNGERRIECDISKGEHKNRFCQQFNQA